MSTVNGKSREFPPTTTARNIADLSHDVVHLGELQTELFKLDLSDTIRRLILPTALLAVGVVVALSCVPLVLAALGFALMDAGMSGWAAFLTAALTGVGCAAFFGLVSYLTFRKAPSAFERSRDEFVKNIDWLKRVLKAHRS